MGSDLPKVLLPLCGCPMITYILDMLSELGIARPVVVISKSGDKVKETLGDRCRYALQDEQLGSGHAVLCAREEAQGSDHIIVMCGDSPLFRKKTVHALMETHIRENAAITLTSAILENPHGYGRILRSADGEVSGIAEEKLATDEQKAIKEVNGGSYAFDANWLWDNIDLMHKNEAGEYCLTEMVDIAISQGHRVVTVSAAPDELQGINTPDQLREAEEVLKKH